ncbi:component of the polarisome [Recurvomyces mirabilis]|nr:component of the polarisome [Recurvomyces mirabilis]
MAGMGTTGDVPYSGGPYGAARPGPPSLPGSQHPSGSTDMSRPSASGSSIGRPPSSASSVGRSSDGRMFGSRPDSGRSTFKPDNEAALSRHYEVLKGYLSQHLADQHGNIKPNKARDKLLRLSVTQFMELSTDVYDELLRREDDRTGRVQNVPKSLLPRQNFHPKRNQARQKLSTLPVERFRQLATDVFYELERRIPRFIGQDMERPSSIASSARGPSRNGMRPPAGGPPPPGGYRGPPPNMGGRPPMGGPPMNGMPPPMGGPYQSFRPASPGPGGPGGRPPTGGSDSSNYNRPLPKTFQSNTIVPNKSTMVEDDDDDDEDAFDLDKGLPDPAGTGSAEDKEKIEAQEAEIAELREKLEELEGAAMNKEHEFQSMNDSLAEREQELERTKSSGHEREDGISRERSEWYDLREELEQKHLDAQRLHDDLQRELEAFKRNKDQDEHEIRSQHDLSLEDLRSQHGQQLGGLQSQHDRALDDMRSQHEQELGGLQSQMGDSHRMTIGDLRAQLNDVHDQTSDLHTQLQTHQAENDELRRQLQDHQDNRPKSVDMSDYERRIELLQDELAGQEKLTNEVRDEAMLYLREMRDLSRQNDQAIEAEERLAARVTQLERENEEWRHRYAKVKAQNRHLRASTMGLGLQTSFDSGSLLRKEGLVSEGGLVRDVDVTRFQLAIDELLKVARQQETEPMLESVKHIAISVHAIESAVGTDGYPTPSPSPLGPMSPNGEHSRGGGTDSVAKLQARVKGTANSLITATRLHATSHGLSPVALLDAAASNLTASVVELIKAVGIKPSSKDELQSDLGDEDRYSNMHSLAPSVNDSLGAKLQHDSIGSFYDDRDRLSTSDAYQHNQHLPPSALGPAPAAVAMLVPSSAAAGGETSAKAAAAAASSPAPLSLGRSNTSKKTNGWFGGWGKKSSIDETEALPSQQVQGHGLVAGDDGEGQRDGEYDPYR